MGKKYYIFPLLLIAAFATGWLIPKHNYSIFGSGEGAIMIDLNTGNAWVLEIQQRTITTTSTNPLCCEEDFCSPNGVRYYWVPTAVRSCYGNAISVGRNPEEADKADKDALASWEHKSKRYTQQKN